MVKSVHGVNHQGLRDWLFQHLTALMMAIYFIGFLIILMKSPSLTYVDWHAIFAKTWMKIATLIMFVGLLYHAWVGMWTIFTDYVHPACLRLALHCLLFLALMTYFFAGLLILWGV